MKTIQYFKLLIQPILNISILIFIIFIPNYTKEYSDNVEQQYWEIKCYKNGKYTHSVSMYYFTKKQIEIFNII